MNVDIPFEENMYLQSLIKTKLKFEDNDKLFKYDYAQRNTFKWLPYEKSSRAQLPESGTKLFTFMKDNYPFIDNVLTYMSQHTVYSITHKDDEPLQISLHGKDGIVYSISRKRSIQELKGYYYIELDTGDFGHFGAAYFDGSVLKVYDSMAIPEYEVNTYTYEFVDILNHRLLFNGLLSMDNVVEDFCKDASICRSMEITGGTATIPNLYMKSFKQQKIRVPNLRVKDISFYKFYNMYGVDNQNSFCYMWALLYLWVNVFSDYDFPSIHKRICELKILPIVYIKSFVYWLIRFFKNDPNVITNDMKFFIDNIYFDKNFYLITSNSTEYSNDGTFNSNNLIFYIYELQINKRLSISKPNDVVMNAFKTVLVELDAINS